MPDDKSNAEKPDHAEIMRLLLEADLESLPELTAKEQAFVLALLEGRPIGAAYRESFDASNMRATSIAVAATRLKNSPKIEAWLAAGRKAYLGTAAITLDAHLKELERLRELAIQQGNISAAIQAEQSRGKAVGLYVERRVDLTPPDPIKSLVQLASVNPVLAKTLAEQFGLKPTKVIEH